MLKVLVSVLLFGSMAGEACAVENIFFGDRVPKHVNDRFLSAWDGMQSEWVGEFIDSLYNVSKKEGVPEYECMANILKAYQAHMKGDSVAFFDYSNVALKQTLDLGSKKLYYNLLVNQVGFYMGKHNVFKAQKVAELLIADASESNDVYGLTYGYLSLAMLMSERSDFMQAITYYKKVLTCMEKLHRDNVSRAQIIYTIGSNYANMKNYKVALKYFDEALALVPEMFESQVAKAECFFKLGDYGAFKTQYSMLYADPAFFDVENKNSFLYISAANSALNKEYNKAFAICDSIDDNMMMLSAKSDIYMLMNDWQNAYDCYRKANSMSDSLRQAAYVDLLVSAESEMEALYKLNEKDEEVRQNRMIVLYVSFGLIVILVVFFAAAMFYRQRERWQKNRLEIITKYNAELAVAKEKAEDADRIKTQFLQNISHDLRTPLNAIVGFSQLLGLPDGFNSEEEKEQYNSYITNNSEMLMMLFEDILNMNEIEKGNFKLEYKEISCNNLCRKILKCVEYRVLDNVKLEFTSNVGDDFKINTDGRRVQQVLVNFLTNACKHTTEGEIRLDCNVDETEGTITYSVIDTGEGVAEDIRDSIFERFVKCGDKEDSHGIGLNICTTIAKKMNGIVQLDQSYTNGAKFDFILKL